jgi:hypothetical protein
MRKGVMNTADLNTKLIDSYISLLKNMSKPNKLELISRLTNTVKSENEQEKADFYKAFGGWDKNESAEDLIETIRGSKTFNRTIEEF